MNKKTQSAKKQSAKPSQVKKKQGQQAVSKKKTVAVARGNTQTNVEPRFKSSSPGCVRVEKSEYIADILSAVEAWKLVDDFRINPGDEATFPWLSQLATQFESYKFHRLVFEFKTSSPTLMAGFVGMAVDYNPNEPAPTSKVQFLEMEEAVRTQVWENCTHVSTQKNLSKRKSYFNSSHIEVAEDTDKALYDVGNLYISSGGQNAATFPDPVVIGELWVHYDVEFTTPEYSSGGGSLIAIYAGEILTQTPNKPLGNNPVLNVHSTPGWILPIPGSFSDFVVTQTCNPLLCLILQTTGSTAFPDAVINYSTIANVAINGVAASPPTDMPGFGLSTVQDRPPAVTTTSGSTSLWFDLAEIKAGVPVTDASVNLEPGDVITITRGVWSPVGTIVHATALFMGRLIIGHATTLLAQRAARRPAVRPRKFNYCPELESRIRNPPSDQLVQQVIPQNVQTAWSRQ